MSIQGNGERLISTRLSVLSWNIWWRYGPWQQRRPAIISTLKSLDADIIGLQEVWSDETTNFAAELAAELGYHHVFTSTNEIEGIGFGNAILSRWPIEQHDLISMYGQNKNVKTRGALFTEIAGPRGSIPVFCTHLSWRYQHSHIRQRQVEELARFIDTKRPLSFPPIVCGDFNAEPMSEEMRMLTGLTSCPVEDLVFHDAWHVADGDGDGYTWSNTNFFAAEELEPDRRIDYILVGHPKARGAGHITECHIVGNQPVADVWPSDHFALLTKLRY